MAAWKARKALYQARSLRSGTPIVEADSTATRQRKLVDFLLSEYCRSTHDDLSELLPNRVDSINVDDFPPEARPFIERAQHQLSEMRQRVGDYHRS